MYNVPNSLVCYLDLDGVLVDFVSGALAIHGKTLDPSEVRWDFLTQIGFQGVNDPAFWEPLGFDFWANLDFTAEACQVLNVVESVFKKTNVVLLTSPCDTNGAVEGKVAWIRKNLPTYRRQFFVGPPKHLVAGPGKVLVDDHDANVDAFVKHGGKSVLVPRPWNRRRQETDDRGWFDASKLANELTHAIQWK